MRVREVEIQTVELKLTAVNSAMGTRPVTDVPPQTMLVCTRHGKES